MIIPVFIEYREPMVLGGASFVQIAIGFNLSLMAFKSFRDYLDYSWGQLKEDIKAHEATLLDVLRKRGPANPEEIRDRATCNIQASTLNTVHCWQQRFWKISRVFSFATVFLGVGCLYFDKYCKWDALLLLPWPAYWIASYGFCRIQRNVVMKKYKVVGESLVTPEVTREQINKQVQNALNNGGLS